MILENFSNNTKEDILINDYVKNRTEYFENGLKTAFANWDSKYKNIVEPMEYSLFAGGKRIRPLFFFAVLEMFGKDYKKFLPFAMGLEMIHTYSLIHDDLPAMDDDDLRRGKPTNHKVFGEANAILAGDGLLTHSFYMMLSCKNDEVKPENLLRAVSEVSLGAGPFGMVAGQVLDLESEQAGEQLNIERLVEIHLHKTGALFRAAIESAGIIGDCTEEEEKALVKFAHNFGLYFQIADDILDIVSTEEELGKPTGSDIKNDKSTYPALLGLEESCRLAEERLAECGKALEIFGDKSEILKELSIYFVEKNKIKGINPRKYLAK